MAEKMWKICKKIAILECYQTRERVFQIIFHCRTKHSDFFFLFYVKKYGSTKTQPSPFSNLLITMSCFRLETIFDPKPNMTRPICHVCLRKKPKWALPRAGIHASRMSRLFYINRLIAYKLNKELNCKLVVK